MTIILSSFSTYADMFQSVSKLQKDWAVVTYTLKGEQQKEAFEQLIVQADNVVSQYPKRAESLIWRGIIQSSYAGVKGGLSALSLVKSSKVDLEKALQLNDKALSGSAYTSLGTLYFKVPGWPLGFGDNDKAEKLLKKSISLNPKGMDSNYFYAEYLAEQHKYNDAEKCLLLAKKAPARLSRPLADKGRYAEIETSLEKIRKIVKAKSSTNNNKIGGM